MSLTTRLTEFCGIEHPMLLAPMALVSGGRLAAAVTAAGGLGLIGGGYGEADWLQAKSAKTTARESDTGSSPGAWLATPGCSTPRWHSNPRPSCCPSAI